VDIVSPGDQLPLDDNSVDFVISSHVIEHFPDPIKALKEWYRVVKPGGYLYIIAPRRIRQGRRILLVTSEVGGVGYGLRV
jgi:ubiquinone/menaquinone biosynthesis C-methylase UbiE